MSGRLVGNIVIQAIMKKILLFVTILMTSCPIFAQSIPPLVRYEPVIVDRNGNRVNTDGSPYDENYYRQNTPQVTPAEVITTRGYYFDNDVMNWSSILIKVEVGERRVKLVGYKGRGNWQKCNAHAREVSFSDDEFIQQNFSYYANLSRFGTIYF